jgi:hypothetical protein
LLPVLVLTARAEPELINRAHGLRAEYHCKPTHRSSLRGLLRRAVAFERVEDVRISWAIDEMSAAPAEREADLTVAAVAGVPRKTLSDELGSREHTQDPGAWRAQKVRRQHAEELARTTSRSRSRFRPASAQYDPRRKARPASERPACTQRRADGRGAEESRRRRTAEARRRYARACKKPWQWRLCARSVARVERGRADKETGCSPTRS